MDEVRDEIRAGAAPLKAMDNVAKKGLGKLATADIGKLFLAIAGASSVCCAAVAGAKGVFRAVVRRVPLLGRPAAVAADVLLPSGLYGSLLAGYLAVTAVRASLQKLSAERGDGRSETDEAGSAAAVAEVGGGEQQGERRLGSEGGGAGVSGNRRRSSGRSRSGNSLSGYDSGGVGEARGAAAAAVGDLSGSAEKGKGGCNSHLWAKLHPLHHQQQHQQKPKGHNYQQGQVEGHDGSGAAASAREDEGVEEGEDGRGLRRKGMSVWVGSSPSPLPMVPHQGGVGAGEEEEEAGSSAAAAGGDGGGAAAVVSGGGGGGGGGKGRKGFLRGKRQHKVGKEEGLENTEQQQLKEDGEGEGAPGEGKQALFGWWKGKVERANSISSSKSLDLSQNPGLGRTQSAGAAVLRTSSLGSSASAATQQGLSRFGPSFGVTASYDLTRRNSVSEGFKFTALPVEPKSDEELRQLKAEQLSRRSSVSEGCKQVVAAELKVTAKKVEHMASMAPMITRLPSGRGGCRITAAAAAAVKKGGKGGESPRVSCSGSQLGSPRSHSVAVSPTHSGGMASPRELLRSPRTSSESVEGLPVQQGDSEVGHDM